jgi:GMP synthase (glutamine-hydrolysing)
VTDPRPILVIEHEPGAPIARLGDWLREAGAELDVRFAPAAELPDDLSEYSGLIVMGGSPNAYQDDRAPWLPGVRLLLAKAVAAQLPTLGVCLGGQLLAAATGGRVERAEEPEYGAYLVAKRQAAATDPLFRELPITPDVLQWHVDTVSQLPPGAVLLASSPGIEVQAFRVGRLAWGLQFHIETTPEIVRGWAAGDAAELGEYDLDAILARADAVHPDLAQVWRGFAATFVAITADPDAAWAAVPGPQHSGSTDPTLGRTSLQMAGSHGGHPVSSAEPISDPAAVRAALAAEMQASREHR